MKRLFMLMLAVACAPAAALELEPGEWEFTSTSTSRLFPAPQTQSFKRCIKKEEAADPDRWMAKPGEQGDCKLTPGAKTADTYTWQMECPKANMRGNGSARMRGGAMEGETHMTGEIQGQKFELRTKVTGRRLGPCKP
jgi:hypothetical protein